MAGATIGQLVVELVANTARFKTDLDAANRIAKNSADGIQGAFKNVGGALTTAIGSMISFRAVIGTVLGSGGLGLMVKNALSAGDAIVEMAERVGVSTTALQELSYAAKLSGASVEDLEQGLRLLNKRLGEAQAGEKSAVEAFRAIKVDPTQFRDAGEAIGAVADGLLTMGTEAQRTAAQLDLFGRGGGQLAGMLREGSAGLTRMGRAAQELGIVLDAKLLAEMSKLSDQFDVLSMVIRSNFIRVLADLGPLLLSITGGIAEMTREARKMYEFFFVPDAALRSISDLNERIAQTNRQIAEAKGRIAGAPPGTMAADEALLKNLEARKAALEKLTAVQREYNRAVEPAKKPPIPEIPRATLDAVEEFRRKLVLLAIPDETAKRMVELKNEANKLKDAAPGLATEIQKIADAMGEIITQAAAAEVLKKFDEEAQKLREVIDAGTVAAIEAEIDAYENELRVIAAINDERAKATEALEAQHTAGLIAAIEAEIDAYEGELSALAKIQDETMRARQARESVVTSLQQQIEMLGMSARQAAIYASELKLSADASNDLRQQTRELAGNLYDLNQALADNRLVESLEQQIAAFGMSAEAALIYQNNLKLSADASDDLRARVAALSKEVADYNERQRMVAQATQVAVYAATQLADTIYDLATTGEEDFGEAVTKIIHAINKMILAMLIAEGVARGLRAAMGIFGTTPAMETAQGAGTMTAGADVLRGYAKGGVVKARAGGRLIIAGEAGQDEAIIPLDRMNQIGGGGGVTVVNEIHNHTDAQVETRQQRGGNGQVLNQIIIRAVQGAADNGSLDKTLGRNYGLTRTGR